MGRTKQTCRKSTGGKAPRKLLAVKPTRKVPNVRPSLDTIADSMSTIKNTSDEENDRSPRPRSAASQRHLILTPEIDRNLPMPSSPEGVAAWARGVTTPESQRGGSQGEENELGQPTQQLHRDLHKTFERYQLEVKAKSTKAEEAKTKRIEELEAKCAKLESDNAKLKREKDRLIRFASRVQQSVQTNDVSDLTDTARRSHRWRSKASNSVSDDEFPNGVSDYRAGPSRLPIQSKRRRLHSWSSESHLHCDC